MTHDELMAHPLAAITHLCDRLRDFLTTTDHGEGGSWPDITNDQRHEALNLFADILVAKWGVDCDQDIPVRISLTIRRNEKVDRKLAMKIAVSNGQFNRKIFPGCYNGPDLYSEDLW